MVASVATGSTSTGVLTFAEAIQQQDLYAI